MISGYCTRNSLSADKKISKFKFWPLKRIENFSWATFITYLLSFTSILGTLIIFVSSKKCLWVEWNKRRVGCSLSKCKPDRPLKFVE